MKRPWSSDAYAASLNDDRYIQEPITEMTPTERDIDSDRLLIREHLGPKCEEVFLYGVALGKALGIADERYEASW